MDCSTFEIREREKRQMRGMSKKRCRDNKAEERKADLMFIFSRPVLNKKVQYYYVTIFLCCNCVHMYSQFYVSTKDGDREPKL